MKYHNVIMGIIFLIVSQSLCANPNIEESQEDKDIKRKMAIAEKLINDAVLFLEKNSLGIACRAFEKDPRWVHGDLDINIFDSEGTCYLLGITEVESTWTNFKKTAESAKIRGTTALSTDFIDQMVSVGDKGGGWMTYDWNYASKYVYVRTVVKNGVKFILSSGMYPASPRFKIQQLVKSAIRYGEDNGAEVLFQEINNPAGNFVQGDDYLWAYRIVYDDKGNAKEFICEAHGRNRVLIGQDAINWQDSDGNYRNKIMIEIIQKNGSGWVDYKDGGVLKYTFFQSFTDPRTGKKYIVGGGYYPTVNNEMVVKFVKRAVEYLKSQGSTVALRDFSSYAGTFINGPLRITVFDLKGKVLADANNTVFLGQNIIKLRDSEDKYWVKELLENAIKYGRYWVSYMENRAYKSSYAEYVETPDGKFIITAGFWPSSKEYAAQALAEKAATFLDQHPYQKAMFEFTAETGASYLHGDLFVEVYNDEGICYVYGYDLDRIWNNEKVILDERGYPVIDRVIDVAKRGGGWVEYPRNKGIRRAYTTQVVKTVPLLPEEIRETKEETVSKAGVVRKATKGTEAKETFIVSVGFYK